MKSFAQNAGLEEYVGAGFLKTLTGKCISGSGPGQRAASNIHVGRRARYTSDTGGEPAARIASVVQNGSLRRHPDSPHLGSD